MTESLTGGYLTPQTAAIGLLLIGLYGLVTQRNLVKQVICINILSFAVVLYFIGVGYVPGGFAPILPVGETLAPETIVDPLPATLMLTGLVVDVAVTAVALALVIRIAGGHR